MGDGEGSLAPSARQIAASEKREAALQRRLDVLEGQLGVVRPTVTALNENKAWLLDEREKATESGKVYVEQLERCGAQREGLVEEVKQRHAVALKRIRERHEKGVCGTRLRLKEVKRELKNVREKILSLEQQLKEEAHLKGQWEEQDKDIAERRVRLASAQKENEKSVFELQRNFQREKERLEKETSERIETSRRALESVSIVGIVEREQRRIVEENARLSDELCAIVAENKRLREQVTYDRKEGH